MDDLASRLRTTIARTERLLAREGGEVLTRTQFSVLGAVARATPQRVSDLAQREGLHPTMLSRVVSSLEGAGLVHRTTAPEDGRQVLVHVTAAGKAVYASVQEHRTERIEQWLTTLSAVERERVEAALPVLEGMAALLQEVPA